MNMENSNQSLNCLPEVGKAVPCCDSPQLEIGFGLAGGGYGVYEYCTSCNKVVSKSQEEV